MNWQSRVAGCGVGIGRMAAWPHGPHAARQGQGAASRTRATLAQSRKVEAFERSLKDRPSIFIGATEALGNEVDLSFN